MLSNHQLNQNTYKQSKNVIYIVCVIVDNASLSKKVIQLGKVFLLIMHLPKYN